jgi:hypothetical protein
MSEENLAICAAIHTTDVVAAYKNAVTAGA